MSLTERIQKDTYTFINIVLVAIIVSVVIYSLAFSPGQDNYPINSANDRLTGEQSLSSGMSRAFSCIVRGNIPEARKYNPLSIRIFTFLLLQLGLRTFMIFFRSRIREQHSMFVTTDAIISSVLFILYFYPFFEEMVTFL